MFRNRGERTDTAAVRAHQRSALGERVQIAASSHYGNPEPLGDLLNGNTAMTSEESEDLPSTFFRKQASVLFPRHRAAQSADAG
jgi:hypothetical protein